MTTAETKQPISWELRWSSIQAEYASIATARRFWLYLYHFPKFLGQLAAQPCMASMWPHMSHFHLCLSQHRDYPAWADNTTIIITPLPQGISLRWARHLGDAPEPPLHRLTYKQALHHLEEWVSHLANDMPKTWSSSRDERSS